MPRGAEYADGPIQSDNAIESTENKVVGAPQDGSDNVRAAISSYADLDFFFRSQMSSMMLINGSI